MTNRIAKGLIEKKIIFMNFKEFDKKDMENYLNSGECFGKAGSIMVEGFCRPYIKNVSGFESTAMGLCVEKLKMFM